MVAAHVVAAAVSLLGAAVPLVPGTPAGPGLPEQFPMPRVAPVEPGPVPLPQVRPADPPPVPMPEVTPPRFLPPLDGGW